MYLRVTSFKSAPAQLEQSIAFVRDKAFPALFQEPGCLGGTVVVNREKGEGAASTLWDSVEAMNNAERAGVQARQDATESAPLEVIDVDRFEVTVMEMSSTPGELPSYARVVTGYGDPSHSEAAVEALRGQLPTLKSQPGLRSFAAGVNRATGRSFTISTFESPEAREASNAALEPSRKQVIESGKFHGMEIELVEVVVAEIKQPATA